MSDDYTPALNILNFHDPDVSEIVTPAHYAVIPDDEVIDGNASFIRVGNRVAYASRSADFGGHPHVRTGLVTKVNTERKTVTVKSEYPVSMRGQHSTLPSNRVLVVLPFMKAQRG